MNKSSGGSKPSTKGRKSAKEAVVEEAAKVVKEPQLSDEEATKIRDAFHKVDADQNGTLDGLELRKLFLELERGDLNPDRDVDAIRRLCSKRKDNRITEADRCDLRATLRFFALRPRPQVTGDSECSRHLFETLAEGTGKKDADVMLPVSQIEQLLKDSFDLEVDAATLLTGADSLSLADFQKMISPKVDDVNTGHPWAV